MAIKNFSYGQKKRQNKKVIFLIFYALVFLGCQSLKTQQEVEEITHVDTSAPEAPLQEQVVDQKADVEEKPVSHVLSSPKVGLILGPGGARTFAHAGVISGLESSGINLDMIIGIEWGALVGAIYAQSPKSRELEWRINKIGEFELKNNSGLFGSGLERVRVQKFTDQFGISKNALVEDFSMEFQCPSLSMTSGYVKWVSRGKLGAVLSRCLTYAPYFESESDWVSSASNLKDAVRRLKNQGAQVILISHVLGGGDLLPKKANLPPSTRILWQEIRNSLNQQVTELAKEQNVEIISVVVNHYDILSFDKAGPIIMAGQRAGKHVASKLLKKYDF